MKRGITKILATLAIVIVAIGMSAMAQGAPAGETIKLSVGKAGTINLPKPAADVLVASPGVADVGSLRSDRLYVVGKAIGDTNVLVFDDAGNQIADVAIQVRADQQTLRETVKEFFPKESIDVRTVNDSIVLQGEVSTPAVANQVRDLVGRFVKSNNQTLVDLMKVQGEQQVMLKVKVIEASRSVLREYGIQTGLGGVDAAGHLVPGINAGRLTSGFLTSQNGGISANTFTGAVGLAAVTEFGGGALALTKAGKFGPLEVDFQGLENQGLVNTLAEPTLTAISGETAGFLAGGEFPVPASRDSSGNITVEFKQFGVALNFIPTVLTPERISLQLTSEVSEKSDVDGVTFGGITVPGLAIRRAQTTVEMGSGGTLMIAGLLKSSTTDAMNGYPGLSNIPILGNLFKSKSFQRGESELVFIVTPYIVKPYGHPEAERVAAATPLPSELVTTSHAVSLSDLHSHTTSTIPSSAAVPTAVPSATPAGVPLPVTPAMPLPIRHSDASPLQKDTQFAEAKPVKVIWNDAKGASAPIKTAALKPSEKSAMPGKLAAAPAMKAVPVKPVQSAALGKLAAPLPLVSKTPVKQAQAFKQPVSAKPVPVKTAAIVKAVAPAAKPAPAKAIAASKAVAAMHQKTAAAAKPAAKINAAATAAAAQDPLAATFIHNLKSVYGNKAPSTVTSGPSVGYIVD